MAIHTASLNPVHVALLAVLASVLVPILTEWLKSRFGAREAHQKQEHYRHQELISEIANCRAEIAGLRNALGVSEKSETEWQHMYQDVARREIVLLRDAAGKDRLVSGRAEDWPCQLDERKNQ